MNDFEPGDKVHRFAGTGSGREHGIYVETGATSLWVWPLRTDGSVGPEQRLWTISETRLTERFDQRLEAKPPLPRRGIRDPLTPLEESELKRFLGIPAHLPVPGPDELTTQQAASIERYRGIGGDRVLPNLGMTVNEARRAKGLEPLRNRDGSERYEAARTEFDAHIKRESRGHAIGPECFGGSDYGDDMTDAMLYAAKHFPANAERARRHAALKPQRPAEPEPETAEERARRLIAQLRGEPST